MRSLRSLTLSGLLLSALTVLPAGAQPPNFKEFGFDPGKKGPLEGVVFTAGPQKGEKAAFHTLLESAKFHSILIYARQPDETTFAFVKALDAQATPLKRCPTYFVGLLTDADAVAEKTAKVENVTVCRSYSRTNPRDWARLGLDPKLATIVLLIENRYVKTRIDLKEGEMTDDRSKELVKQLTAFAEQLTPEEAAGLQMTLGGHGGGARQLAFSADGKWLYSQGCDESNGLGGKLKKWDLATGKEVAAIETYGAGPETLALTPDGKQLVTVGFDKAVKVWDAETLKAVNSVPLTEIPMSGCLSPDGKRITLGGRDKKVRVYDLAEKAEKQVFEGLTDRVTALAYTPDGKFLLAGDELGKMKCWDLESGKEAAPCAGHTNTVQCFAFGPGGKWVVSGGREMRGTTGPGRARLWDMASGKEVRELESTGVNGVLAVALLDEGKTLAIAGENTVIKLIDLSTGKVTGELPGHRSAVLSLAVSADGSTLASGDWWGPIRIWKVKKEKK